jgi:hypothetical protein
MLHNLMILCLYHKSYDHVWVFLQTYLSEPYLRLVSFIKRTPLLHLREPKRYDWDDSPKNDENTSSSNALISSWSRWRSLLKRIVRRVTVLSWNCFCLKESSLWKIEGSISLSWHIPCLIIFSDNIVSAVINGKKTNLKGGYFRTTITRPVENVRMSLTIEGILNWRKHWHTVISR